jgi:four helix bundle protein
MLDVKCQNQNSKAKGDLKHRAYYFSVETLKFLEKLPTKRIFYSISDQLLRSATSIGANIVEAKSSSSKRDFIKFYEIALKSSNEVKYWLCLIRDSNLEMDRAKIQPLLNEVIEISNMIGAAILTLKGKRR